MISLVMKSIWTLPEEDRSIKHGLADFAQFLSKFFSLFTSLRSRTDVFGTKTITSCSIQSRLCSKRLEKWDTKMKQACLFFMSSTNKEEENARFLSTRKQIRTFSLVMCRLQTILRVINLASNLSKQEIAPQTTSAWTLSPKTFTKVTRDIPFYAQMLKMKT